MISEPPRSGRWRRKRATRAAAAASVRSGMAEQVCHENCDTKIDCKVHFLVSRISGAGGGKGAPSMYTQGLLDQGGKGRGDRAVAGGRRLAAALPGARRRRGEDRAEGLDARGLPADADPADLAARAFGDRRHAARGQLDHARADAAAQGDPDRQGAGRGRPRRLPVQRRRDARHLAAPSWSSSCSPAGRSTRASSTTRRRPGPTSARSAGWSTARRS